MLVWAAGLWAGGCHDGCVGLYCACLAAHLVAALLLLLLQLWAGLQTRLCWAVPLSPLGFLMHYLVLAHLLLNFLQ